MQRDRQGERSDPDENKHDKAADAGRLVFCYGFTSFTANNS